MVGKLPTLANRPQYGGFTGPVDASGWERYGTPFDDKYLLDRNSLFLPNLTVNAEAMEEIGAGPDITTLTTRRSLFLRLFPDCKMPVLDSTGVRRMDVEVPASTRVNSNTRALTVIEYMDLDTRDPAAAPTPSSVDNSDLQHHRTHTMTDLSVATQGTNQSAYGPFRVEVWTHEGRFTTRTAETKAQWITVLRGYSRHNFTLWDAESLLAVDPEALEIYLQTYMIAVPANFDINRLRQIRGMAVG